VRGSSACAWCVILQFPQADVQVKVFTSVKPMPPLQT
jgi:hypothetical protein